MISKTYKTLSFLLAAASLVMGTAEALIYRVDVLKKDVDGTEQYIYCLSDYHAENLIASARAGLSDSTDAQEFLKQPINHLTNLTIAQGNALASYISQLGDKPFVLINEDLLMYNGNEEVLKEAIQDTNTWRRAQGLGATGSDGFLAYATEIFTQKSWPMINAECRHYNYVKSLDQAKAALSRTFDIIETEINLNQSAMPNELKNYSQTCFSKAYNAMHAIILAIDHQQPANQQNLFDARFIVDARIPNLIYGSHKAKHIFLSLGGEHINRVIPQLCAVGYKVDLSRGIRHEVFDTCYRWENQEIAALEQEWQKEFEVLWRGKEFKTKFLDTIALNLKDVFEQCTILQTPQARPEFTKAKHTKAKALTRVIKKKRIPYKSNRPFASNRPMTRSQTQKIQTRAMVK